MTRPAERALRLLLALLAAAAAAGCDADTHCGSDDDCDNAQQACRPDLTRCPGNPGLATIAGGHCRYQGQACSSDLDCVPLETCASDGWCRPAPPQPPQCTVPPSCSPECPLQAPFPCACVCAVCPAPPDGGV